MWSPFASTHLLRWHPSATPASSGTAGPVLEPCPGARTALRQSTSPSIHRLSRSDLMPASNLGKGWQGKHQTQPHSYGEAPAGAGIVARMQHRSPTGTSEPRAWLCHDTRPARGSWQSPAFISPPGKCRFVSKTYQQRVLVPRGSVPRRRAKAPLLLSNLPGSRECPRRSVAAAWPRGRSRVWQEGGTARHGVRLGSLKPGMKGSAAALDAAGEDALRVAPAPLCRDPRLCARRRVPPHPPKQHGYEPQRRDTVGS